jgi:hypothetical protein
MGVALNSLEVRSAFHTNSQDPDRNHGSIDTYCGFVPVCTKAALSKAAWRRACGR